MSIEVMKDWQVASDAAGIVRAHGHHQLAERLLQIAEAIEQMETQEPVAWLIDNGYTTVFRDIAETWRSKGANVDPLYATPPAAPVQKGN